VLPVFLGGFLILLAIGALGHTLMTAVRRRAHDLAVLRVLGITTGQSRWATVIQAMVFALSGVLLGVPLGLVAGRTLWRVAAGLIPLYYQPPWAPWALILIAPLALACAVILAAIPGQRAARLRPGPLLRGE
jgi:ABC-type lipoprotein release transport system permease subunit